MAEVYGGPRPIWTEEACGSIPSILKWTHSIIYEPTFKTEWQARETARGLALEMAPNGILTRLSVSTFSTTSRTSSSRQRVPKSVTFAPEAEGCDKLQSMNWHCDAVNVPGIVTYKPDPAEHAQLPDPAAHPDAHGHGQGHVHGVPLIDRPYWQQQVWQRLQEEGEEEDPGDGDGPVLMMNSYFICHLTNQRQESSRPVRFDQDIDTWEQEMRFVWEGLAEPNLPISVYLVTPEPAFPLDQAPLAPLDYPKSKSISCSLPCHCC
jgi:hypothetical protein